MENDFNVYYLHNYWIQSIFWWEVKLFMAVKIDWSIKLNFNHSSLVQSSTILSLSSMHLHNILTTQSLFEFIILCFLLKLQFFPNFFTNKLFAITMSHLFFTGEILSTHWLRYYYGVFSEHKFAEDNPKGRVRHEAFRIGKVDSKPH